MAETGDLSKKKRWQPHDKGNL